jgi:hypothetical protein
VLEVDEGVLGPELVPELIAAHQSVGVFEQPMEDEKRLPLELYPDSMLPELFLRNVELEGAEPKHDAQILLVGHSPRRVK